MALWFRSDDWHSLETSASHFLLSISLFAFSLSLQEWGNHLEDPEWQREREREEEIERERERERETRNTQSTFEILIEGHNNETYLPSPSLSLSLPWLQLLQVMLGLLLFSSRRMKVFSVMSEQAFLLLDDEKASLTITRFITNVNSDTNVRLCMLGIQEITCTWFLTRSTDNNPLDRKPPWLSGLAAWQSRRSHGFNPSCIHNFFWLIPCIAESFWEAILASASL